MAPSCKQLWVAALVVMAAAVLASSPASAQLTHDNCAKNKKVTVQNLCPHDVKLTLEPLANSPHLFNGAEYTLKPHSHAEFPVCWWTGRLKSAGALTAEFHVGVDGGSFYLLEPGQQQAAGAQNKVPVVLSPHGAPLVGGCPAIGCSAHGKCSLLQVPTGKCSNVQEIKVIYCSPDV